MKRTPPNTNMIRFENISSHSSHTHRKRHATNLYSGPPVQLQRRFVFRILRKQCWICMVTMQILLLFSLCVLQLDVALVVVVAAAELLLAAHLPRFLDDPQIRPTATRDCLHHVVHREPQGG